MSLTITPRKEHRIMVVFFIEFPPLERNPNTGEAVGKSSIPPRVVHNHICHDQLDPSAIVLPIVDKLPVKMDLGG